MSSEPQQSCKGAKLLKLFCFEANADRIINETSLKSATLGLAALLLIACSESTATTATPPPRTTTTPVACSGLACAMTKKSQEGFPLPSDATPGNTTISLEIYNTQLAGIPELTDFYRLWFTQQKYTYEPKWSWTDPNVGQAKLKFPSTYLVYCKPGPPIYTVLVTVGLEAKYQPAGTKASIFFVTNKSEDSCP
jgi:hypothetical protein